MMTSNRKGSRQMTKKKARIEIIDIAKAITIFQVIVGHTTGNLEAPLFRRVLYSFHMPLFFFLAGLSIKPKVLNTGKDWLSFIRKNILALVFPYFIWGLIFGNFSFENILKLFYGSWQKIAETGTLTSLWYLPCLFTARIYVQIIFNLLKDSKNKELMYLIVAVACLAAGFMMPAIETGYPFCCDVAFVAAAFILFGVITRKQIIIFSQQKMSILCIAFLASLIIFCLGTVARGDALYLSLMCKSDYGNVFWFLLNSFSGTLVVIIISMIVSQLSRESSRPFSTFLITYIGTRTMGIFLLHKNILQQLIVPVIKPLISNEFLMALVSSVIVMPIVLLLCFVIQRYIPQLLGQFPPNEYKD